MSWFNRTKKASLSIDISSSSIKLLELIKVSNGYRAEHVSIISLPQDLPTQKKVSTTQIAEGIKKAIKESGTSLNQAVIAVAESAITSKIISLPASLTDDEIEEELIMT
ncbi:MAG: pilus assembly protein PilM, partial [Methylococcales bacterium]|nr:pilus assembly protein PilM [Methylococcales bacterium]